MIKAGVFHDHSDESHDTEVTKAFSFRTDQLQLPASQFEDKDTEIIF